AEGRLLAVMLEDVRISGLGVIDDAVLELSPGFTVLTGETGAGKTMVVTGLGLLFGGRADPARVRPGAQRAAVVGRLRTAPDGPVARQVEEAGGGLDEDGTLVLSRRSEEHTSELQSLTNLVCRLLLEKKKKIRSATRHDGEYIATTRTPVVCND